MAAPITCCLCVSVILDKKSYRRTESLKHLKAQLDEFNIKVPSILCSFCFNKLNRLNKLDLELQTRLGKLRDEKNSLTSQLKALPGFTEKITVGTPRRNSAKRCINTPTPQSARKTKRTLTQTPKSRKVLNYCPTLYDSVPFHKEQATQTKICDTDFEVKVIVKYNGVERQRIVHKEECKTAVKQILNNNKMSMRALSKYSEVRDEMLVSIKQKIKSEVRELTKRSNNIMKSCNKNLLNFDTQKFVSFLKDKATYLFEILKTVVKEEKCISTAASVLLYGHSQKLSQLPYIVGLSLDRCGVTKEGLQLMHDFGICVSPRSVLRKKKELVAEQEEKIKLTVTEYVKSCENSSLRFESMEKEPQCNHDVSDIDTSRKTVQNVFAEKNQESPELLLKSSVLTQESKLFYKDESEVCECVETTCGIADQLGSKSLAQNSCLGDLSDGVTIADSEKKIPSIEMLGDNTDVTITPSMMTAESQRKSLHWFLIMMKQKRITVDNMDISELRHEKDILTLPKAYWIPDTSQQELLAENIKHHICHVLVKYVDFLKPLQRVIPPYITHKFVELTKTKSLFLNCELIEASENSASGIISIMQRIHELAVPHARQTDKTVYERVVFGGDVLTNERAFTA